MLESSGNANGASGIPLDFELVTNAPSRAATGLADSRTFGNERANVRVFDPHVHSAAKSRLARDRDSTRVETRSKIVSRGENASLQRRQGTKIDRRRERPQ